MIIQTVKLYRCEFCKRTMSKRKKSLRRHIVARHETICFDNPNRTPQPGELTQAWQLGRFVVDEDGGRVVPHDPMPPWWPGVGMIFTGSKWLPVDGYAPEDFGIEKWPNDESGTELPKVKPWVRRLAVLDIKEEDASAEAWKEAQEYQRAEWER